MSSCLTDRVLLKVCTVGEQIKEKEKKSIAGFDVTRFLGLPVIPGPYSSKPANIGYSKKI